MGMSASQARLLSLQARQSNLEYQGQQINQERTILSQQATALYNSLLSMTVPTPPSTADYQTVQYTGKLGATEYTFDANSIKPDGDLYSITMQEKAHGDSLQKNVTVALVNDKAEGSFRGSVLIPSSITVSGEKGTGRYQSNTANPDKYMVKIDLNVTTTTDEEGNEQTVYSFPNPDPTNYYTLQNGEYTPLSTGAEPNPKVTYYVVRSDKPTEEGADYTGVSEVKDTIPSNKTVISKKDAANLYIEREDGTLEKVDPNDTNYFAPVTGFTDYVELINPNIEFIVESETGGELYNLSTDIAGITVGGKGIHELTEEEIQMYGDAIANSGLKDANGKPYEPDDFFIYYDDKGAAVFVLESDVYDGNTNATTYSYVANGEYTKNTTYDDVQLTFDPTNGRITEIAIPTYADDGSIASWTSISVAAETVTDEAAYEDAYNKYEYDTYLYDQKNKEINAKTEVIQQEDKNLELKLQRLDNERTQITTEIEAVEKVINDNIEASYKTFSG